MTNFRFVHAADLHLDTPFSGIAAREPALAEALRDASLQAFDRLIDLALRERVDALVIAGDIYDGAQRGVRAQLRVLAGLNRLSEAGIPTFITHGNHDPLDGWTAIREWPAHVTVFGSDTVEVVPLTRGGETIAEVAGISFATREEGRNLARMFPPAGTLPRICVLHAHAGGSGSGEHARYAPCTVEDLRKSGGTYWALGHIHQFEILAEAPHIVYSGCLQGRSPKPGETGAKGAVLVTVTAGRVSECRHVPLDGLRFDNLELDLADCDDLGEMQARIDEAAGRVRDASGSCGLILRLRLTGRTVLHTALAQPEEADALLAQLREDADGRQPLLWWDRLTVATSPPVDLDAVRGRDDFAAAVLALADQAEADPKVAAELTEAAWKTVKPLERGRLGVPTAEDAEALLAEARDLALDLLEGADG